MEKTHSKSSSKSKNEKIHRSVQKMNLKDNLRQTPATDLFDASLQVESLGETITPGPSPVRTKLMRVTLRAVSNIERIENDIPRASLDFNTVKMFLNRGTTVTFRNPDGRTIEATAAELFFFIGANESRLFELTQRLVENVRQSMPLNKVEFGYAEIEPDGSLAPGAVYTAFDIEEGPPGGQRIVVVRNDPMGDSPVTRSGRKTVGRMPLPSRNSLAFWSVKGSPDRNCTCMPDSTTTFTGEEARVSKICNTIGVANKPDRDVGDTGQYMCGNTNVGLNIRGIGETVGPLSGYKESAPRLTAYLAKVSLAVPNDQ